MLITLLAFALSASTPATPPKLDPVADQTTVCLAAFVDKIQSVKNGGEPTSIIVPTYTEKAGMNEKDAAAFARGCYLFEQGIFVGLDAAKKASSTPPVADEGDEGRAPDHNNDLTTLKR